MVEDAKGLKNPFYLSLFTLLPFQSWGRMADGRVSESLNHPNQPEGPNFKQNTPSIGHFINKLLAILAVLNSGGKCACNL
jgi:hypothetical protein